MANLKSNANSKNSTKSLVKSTSKPKPNPKHSESIKYRSAVAKQIAATNKIFGFNSNTPDAKNYTKQQLQKQGVPKQYWQ